MNKLFSQAISFFKNQNYTKAKNNLLMILKSNPADIQALNFMGVILASEKNFNRAIYYFKEVLIKKPNDVSVNFNIATALSESDNDYEALKYFQKAHDLSPKNTNILINFGKSLFKLQKNQEAIKLFQIVVALEPLNFEGWLNLGVVSLAFKNNENALNYFKKSLQINNHYLAWNYQGIALIRSNKFNEAIESFDYSIKLNSSYIEPLVNKGLAFYFLKKFDHAIKVFNDALKLNPNHIDLNFNLGNTFAEKKDYVSAIKYYQKIINKNIDVPLLLGNFIHTKMLISDWSQYNIYIEKLTNKISKNNLLVTPFTLLSLTDDANKHSANAKRYSDFHFNKRITNLINQKSNIIKIAYFSSDFCNHPVSQLMLGVLENHDKNQFEIYGFNLRAEEDDEFTKTLKKLFDNFLYVSDLGDKEIADLSKSLKIDIAIDLNGFTNGSRMGIFSYECAPIQVSYLGYPSTTGSNFFDYLIADQVVIPEENQNIYSEKIEYLPKCFMPPKIIKINQNNKNRSMFGLPNDMFVYCCFNNSYKILPKIFDLWLEILKKTENSILWLSEHNINNSENLIEYASTKNIDSSRILFAKRLQNIEDHYYRLSHADLFLDTFPYNGHTTTLDALGSGVPVLTLCGQSFASRVSKSILKSCDLEELIVKSYDEYFEKAIFLKNNLTELNRIKTKIKNFNSYKDHKEQLSFTKNFEKILINFLN